MGKFWALLACFVMLAFAAACTGSNNPTERVVEVAPTPQPAVTATPTPLPTPTPTVTPIPTSTPTPGPVVVDEAEPEIIVEAPLARDILSGDEIVVSGTATDDVGVAEVGVAIRNRDSGEWLRRDGSFGSRQFWDAELSDPDATTTTWSLAFALEPGSWSLVARPEDGEGKRPEELTTIPFDVRVSSDDTTLPTATTEFPPRRDVLAGSDIVVSGSASDNAGVAEVGVAIRNRDNGEWLRRDGSYGSRQFWDAEVAEPGAETTAWSLPLALQPGSWSIVVRAEDQSGNRQDDLITTPFDIEIVTQAANDGSPPTATITGPAEDIVLGSQVVISGSASDDVGIAEVGVAIRDKASGEWLRRDGSFGSRQFWDASLASPGQRTTSWSLPLVLQPGEWSVIVRAEDTNGNRQQTLDTAAFEMQSSSGDSTAPDATIGAPARRAIVTGPGITISGSASDNVGVGAVGVAIRDRNTGLFLRRDGSFGERQFWDARLSSPGAATTSWSLAVTLGFGDWAITVRAEDTSGNRDDSPATAAFVMRV